MLNRLTGVFSAFQENDVRYLVVGGIAAVLYGVPRATFDLDIFIDATAENASSLLQALTSQAFGTASMTTAEDLAAHEITIFNDRVRIDVLTKLHGVPFADAWERRVTMDYQGQAFYVAARQDLIASKMAAGRPVDLEDVRLLELPGPQGPME